MKKYSRYFRLISQIIFLALFFYIFFNSIIDNTGFSLELKLKSKIEYIFAIDPLVALTTLFSTYKLPSVFILSLIVIVFTLIFGRLFCGWVCPFGTIHHFFSFIAQKIRKDKYGKSEYSKYKNLKYYIFTVIVILSIMRVNVSGYLDPLSLLVKCLAIFFLPVVLILYNMDILSDGTQDFLFNNVLGRDNIYYEQAALFGIVFIILLGLNFYRNRFWCKYLCPLGGMLGLISKYSPLKLQHKASCNSCGVCSSSCYADALPSQKNNFQTSECMLLFNCLPVCPSDSLYYGLKTKPAKIDLSKRATAKTLGIALSGFFVIKTGTKVAAKSPQLVRPPGSIPENEFLKTCIRCGACMKVCPENFLAPSLFESGIEGLWTPTGNANYGYCVYNCNLCGKMCPTGAIKELSVEEKKKTTIATAFIDENRCIPYAYGVDCIVCEEHCPTSPKAIYFNTVKGKNYKGESRKIKQPKINPEECIGCGICQYKCPVKDKPAVYMTSIKNGGVMSS